MIVREQKTRIEMQQVKKTTDYTIFKKGSGRYAVRDKARKWVNGEAKEKILLAEQLIKLPEPKAAPAESETGAEPETASDD